MKRIEKFYPNGTRYDLDSNACSYKNGFAQVDTDQDAPYFGQWANPESLKIVCFAEGDLTILIADSESEFVEQMHEIRNFGGFIGIDCMCNDAIKSRFNAMGLNGLLH